MDKIEKYRNIIKSLLAEYAQIRLAYLDEVENQLVFDEAGDHYQLLRIGFENRRRVYYCVFHLDIINSKVWIQVDATDVPIAHRLEAAGVPKEDIVLGFHAPYKRTLEGYAAA
ncbi:MAG: XisI protein [Saprospiraceae bacterium]|nr:XisI protein [Saprospiraceae bacterium]